MERKRLLLVLVVLFAALYYVVRLAIFFASVSGNMEFEEEQSAFVKDFVSYSFFVMGLIGILLLPGVYLLKLWGFWGTVAVSAYSIAFDFWAFLMVQSSAAMGIIPAAVILGYLLVTRQDFLRKR